jgi:hypothetical protein
MRKAALPSVDRFVQESSGPPERSAVVAAPSPVSGEPLDEWDSKGSLPKLQLEEVVEDQARAFLREMFEEVTSGVVMRLLGHESVDHEARIQSHLRWGDELWGLEGEDAAGRRFLPSHA